MSNVFYSAITGGFYDPDVNNQIPSDVVEITDEYRWELIAGQSEGKLIAPDNTGYPVLSDPVINQNQIISKYESALDEYLDSVARADRWDNRFTFVARAAYPNPWQQQAIAFGTWMDECNVYAYALMQGVINGEVELPTIEEFIAGLPTFEHD